MKRLAVAAGFLIMLGAGSPAYAGLVTDFKAPYKWLTEGQSWTVTHDLTDNDVPSLYSVVNADLWLAFADDDNDYEWNFNWSCFCFKKSVGTLEYAVVTGDGISGFFEVDGSHLFGFDFRHLDVGPDGIASLNASGKLEVTVTALARDDGQTNDFWWKKSVLLAHVEPKDVPEPGTLALLGAGLLGLGALRKLRAAA